MSALQTQWDLVNVELIAVAVFVPVFSTLEREALTGSGMHKQLQLEERKPFADAHQSDSND